MKLTLLTACLLLLSQFSYSQEWVRQNPFPDLSQMYDIDFDGPYGLAVGADKTILVTTNAGKTWIRQTATDSATIIQTAHVVPGTSGQFMLAGGGGILMLTENGGQLWKTTHDEIPSVYKIQSLSGGILMALGSDFGIYSTDEGGFWHPFNMPGFDVTAGHFISVDTGWVAFGDFNNQQVWVTTDGGMNWNVLDPLIHPIITSIDMLNDQVGFLASRDYVYNTTDGGNQWLPLHSIASEGGINDLYVVDENNLWSSLNNGSVYFSTDGGTIWHEVNPNLINSNKTLGIWANDKGNVWTVGKYVSILYSPNFGEDWTDQIPASKETMFEPNFYDEFIGMVGGSDGAILRTKNSGAKWEAINFPRNENFFGVKMIDEKIVVTGSSSGKVFLSDDLGDTWTVVGQNLGQITDLHAFNRFEIMVTTESGKIYKTSDGGAIWNIVYNNSSDLLFGLDFFDHQLGWASGWNGKILMTQDGGESWDPQFNDERNKFSDVHFTSATEGWVISSSFTDTIWHTFNAGQTWQTSVLPVKTFWRGISFMTENIGWVTGGSDGYGIVLRTDDGGNGWYLSHESPDVLMGIYAVPGQETVWAVGFGGNIVKYSSCTSPPAITELRGNLEPCVGDTVNFVVEFTGVDLFDWTFPSDWLVVGNTNTSSIYFIAGSLAGEVTIQGSDACGDTTIQLASAVFPVTPPEVIISDDNGTLVSNVSVGQFQWLLNGNPIPGATSPTYQPTVSGTYQLHLTTFTSGCETISNELEVTITGTNHVDLKQILIYPNPAKDILYIKYIDGKSIPEGSKINLTNMDGRVIVSASPGNDHIYLRGVPPGIYALHIQNGNELLLKKIMIE